MYGQSPYSVVSFVLLYVIQNPKCNNGKSWQHLTSVGSKVLQEHPVLELMFGMNQGGQTSCWEVTHCMKPSKRLIKKNQSASITYYYDYQAIHI